MKLQFLGEAVRTRFPVDVCKFATDGQCLCIFLEGEGVTGHILRSPPPNLHEKDRNTKGNRVEHGKMRENPRIAFVFTYSFFISSTSSTDLKSGCVNIPRL